jgi:glyoxylase-like metal-dependent hydrolase (beta-lactamase superfamily II)/rhodanese-related sulfurtransferase
MKVEQLYTNCLAEAAYYIESEGEAAIIDPLRETTPYLKLAEQNGVKIKYIFETHFHADFVSGHLDLAKQTGATIVYGEGATPSYSIHSAKDGEEFKIGKLTIKAIHTPGHTLESTCYLLKDENNKPTSIFTGDTLFINEVGRPDLAVKSNLSKEDLAGMLYDSLHQKIMTLPDHLIVYPAHGAGSACGKNIGKETSDTLGNQKKVNYALQAMPKEEFVKVITEGIMPAPQYFAKNAAMNKLGYVAYEEVISHGTTPLNAKDFDLKIKEGALVLDTRTPQNFCKEFIPNSINIGLDGTFAVWVGTLIQDLNQSILIVAENGREEETIMRLARVGYDKTIGYLKGGINAWKEAGYKTDTIQSVSAEQFAEIYQQSEVSVVDVRKPSEYDNCHLPNATSYPLDFINDNLNRLPKNQPLYLHCAGGYRSMMAISILRRIGYKNIIDIAGGMGAISKTSLPVLRPETA